VSNFQYTGLALTESFEGRRLSAYQDSNGIWTIGDGHTANVKQGDTCTPEQADAWLLEDIQWAANVVNTVVTYPINQNEFNALVDFVFNCGSGHFQHSSLFRDLNAGNIAQCAADMEKWDYAGGQVCAGLLRRRVAEAAEFNSIQGASA